MRLSKIYCYERPYIMNGDIYEKAQRGSLRYYPRVRYWNVVSLERGETYFSMNRY